MTLTVDALSDFQEGQWWLQELDAMVANGTPDQKRAVAVVRNLMRIAHRHIAAGQQGAVPLPDQFVLTIKSFDGHSYVPAAEKSEHGQFCYIDDAIRYGDAREAAASGAWQAIESACVITEAVTPDESDPAGTLRRLIDFHVQMDREAAGRPNDRLTGGSDHA